MFTEGGILFPNQPIERGDARMVIHPPGYSILMAILYGADASSGSNTRLKVLQVISDSLAALLVFFIAMELFPITVAGIAGLLVALSPHLAYYSLWLSPDSLSVIPTLLAVFLIIRAIRRPRFVTVVFAGICLGLSCWLRSNAMLLAPFLAVVTFFFFERSKRLLYPAVLVGAMIVVISPITIRNLVLFNRFIPLSIGAGLNMVEGIADYDTEKRFGMPQYDEDVKLKDAEWHNRPDYAGNNWAPDGVERDQARMARGLEVIRSNPGWFLKVMAKRAAFMLTYNDSNSSDWPFNTARVPLVSAEPGFYHDLASSDAVEVWSASPAEMLDGGTVLSPNGNVHVASDKDQVQIAGDHSTFGDQFASAPISVKENTDYLLAITVLSLQGPMAAKVTGADRRIALASGIISDPLKEAQRESRRRERAARRDKPMEDDERRTPGMIEIPFSSGDRSQVLIAISNNGASDRPPVVELGRARLVEFGPTPYTWTGGARALVRAIQKNLYVARYIVPLILAGIILMSLARRGRALVLLLAVPLYYLLVQSALHTEYRYILAIHYFLFVIASVTLYLLGSSLARGTYLSIKSVKRLSGTRRKLH
ncbi:MAG TPA: glycosyltransferase family 39 protein [Blastocatellia bacterium]|nr:glycosyltransferase family 39 protein [Blastocatellia bacterium]